MIWIKRFILRIQNSDEWTKRRWVVLFSVAAIMAIAAFWIFFTSPFSQNLPAASGVTAADEPGFWQILKNGTSVIFNSAAENFKNIFSRLMEKKTIVIE